MSAARRSPAPEVLAGRLRQRLLALDYPDFARCVCALLEVLGYERARLTGRREWKGYNRPGGGGYDLEAWLPGGLAPRRVIAQVKQFDSLPVHQRSVDELRGACLRAGASEALVITTSAFSDVVRRAAASDQAAGLVAPVRLIDGEELVRLLVHHRLGVRDAGRGRFEMDESFFAGLAAPDVAAAPPKHPIPTRWHVTIRIVRGSCEASSRGRGAKGNGWKGER